MSDFDNYRKKTLAQERLKRYRKKRRLENQQTSRTIFSDDEHSDVGKLDNNFADYSFDELVTFEINGVLDDPDTPSILSVPSEEKRFERNHLTNESDSGTFVSADNHSCSRSHQDEGVDTETIDDEDELRPASVTEDDVDDLTDDCFMQYQEIQELREWALQSKLSLALLDRLLLILRKRLLPDLPKTAKTFLKTNSAKYDIEINEEDASEFVYFGIADPLRQTVNSVFHIDNTIHLLVNVDGLQLFKSSSQQFWPILCQIFSEENVYKPFPVAIYSARHKPTDVHKYLEKFINEVNELQANGLLIDGQMFNICIKSFICDRPARALLKSMKGHGGYWACERCEVRGERVERRIIYPIDDSAAERTDESFRQQTNAGHHIGESPLLAIQPPIDMVSTFVLDFMHLVCLGVMKKLLFYWVNNSSKRRLSYSGKILLSDYLVKIQKQIPCEFHRTTRALVEVDRFKAVEFKFILLYAGPVILRNVLNEDLYKHFLLLHTACRILCSKTRALIDCQNANNLLRKFVILMPQLYGEASIIGNVHNLCHLANDVQVMKCSISNITAFPFENALGQIKKLLRSGKRALAQACRRLHESFSISYRKVTLNSKVQILTQLNPDETGRIIIKRLKYDGITLTTKSPDNCVLLRNNIVLQIKEMFMSTATESVHIKGTKLKKKKSMLSYPCDSKYLHMWNVIAEPNSLETYKLEEVCQKMVTFTLDNDGRIKIFTMPLLHM
ncbi:uncharacterized protein [Fopius arisanus]|uniref:Transposase domain-containing protein n=3 Tax=Fopius arisanus TaxID=64838 RepID=A0A9R1SWH7_9HYME|nr:PREDICTED: uncharacterized protein LOC105263718 [Fopius arisanus]